MRCITNIIFHSCQLPLFPSKSVWSIESSLQIQIPISECHDGVEHRDLCESVGYHGPLPPIQYFFVFVTTTLPSAFSPNILPLPYTTILEDTDLSICFSTQAVIIHQPFPTHPRCTISSYSRPSGVFNLRKQPPELQPLKPPWPAPPTTAFPCPASAAH